jgi:predicted enzyme related to lactoylglutathione lyase
MAAIGDLAWIIVDCSDPALLATFWSQVLGVDVDEALEDPVQYQPLAPVTPNGPKLIFQRVPESKQGKNRLHLDVRVEDIEEAAARIEALGGHQLAGADYSEDGFSWRIMTDPEGNEFCLITTPTPG